MKLYVRITHRNPIALSNSSMVADAFIFHCFESHPKFTRLNLPFCIRLTREKSPWGNFSPSLNCLIMAKRAHTNAELPEDASQSGTSNGIETKKRKVKDIVKTKGDSVPSKLSKEERRELKRLKKLERETLSEETSTNGTPNVETEENLEIGFGKAARKAEKARLKLFKDEGAQEEDTETKCEQNTPGGDQKEVEKIELTEVAGKAAVKAARKAGKKRLESAQESAPLEQKAFDQNAKEPAHEDVSIDHEDETVDKAAVKAERKAEKKRLRALQSSEADEQNGDSKATETILRHVPERIILTTNTIFNTSSSYAEESSLTSLPQSEVDSFLSKHFITISDPSTATTLRPITSFSHLPKVVDTSPFASFKLPTPIQSTAWPFLFSGRDVIGVAETGSGKTLAFGVPCIRVLTNIPKPKNSHGPAAKAVIVSPTRELAVQIHEQIVALATPAGFNSVCVYGGVPKPPQITALRTAHIVIATPGRLNDLISEGAADLSGVHYLVLDEADRMLDKGFEEEIRKIISCCPSTDRGRQTAMFTATWPPSVMELAATFMKDPIHISIGDNHGGELRANIRIEQRIEVVDPKDKEQRLLQILKQRQSGKNKNDRILVFCLYKKEATRVEGFLRSKGMRVAGIHGDLSQENRSRSLESFKSGACPLLVATDVAARGLDIPSVKLVVNCTFPLTVEDYVHRIGRYVSFAISPNL